MPTWNPLNSDPVTGDSIPVAFLELEGRTLALRAFFIGGSPPPSPVEGQGWIDSTSSPYKAYLYVRIDAGPAAWQPIGPLSRLPAAINADPSVVDDRQAPHEFKALRVENRNALPPAAAGNAGLLVYRTTDGELWLSDQPISGAWKGLLSITPAASYDTQELPVEGDLGNDATNPPVKTRNGVLEGWLFSATNQRRTFAFVVPNNWQGATDLKLRLHQVLNANQSAHDAIEWSGEIRALAPQNDVTSKTATALADATTDIGSVTDAIGSGGGPHITTLLLDYDDGANPIAAGSLLLVTVWRKTVGGAGKAGGTLVFRADLAYAQRPRHERA